MKAQCSSGCGIFGKEAVSKRKKKKLEEKRNLILFYEFEIECFNRN